MQKINVAFLVSPHVHLMDLAGPDQVFLEAIGYGAPFELSYCSFTNQVSSSSEMPLGKLPHYSKLNLKANDFLIIPGAELHYLQSTEFKANKKLFDWIRQCYSNGVNICSICSGAFVLAESGILDGKKCTTHWKRTGELQQLYPALNVIENVLFTEDEHVYTSAGIASGIDLALYLIEQLMDQYFAHKIARELVIYCRRTGGQKQQSELLNFRNHIHAGIHQVQDWLQDHLNKKVSIPDLAAMANMSSRNFTRVFKKETSLTVNEYMTRLRKEKIEQLIQNPDISRANIAAECGLKSERHVSRILGKK